MSEDPRIIHEIRRVIWQRQDLPSMEICGLWSAVDCHNLKGHVTVALDGIPMSYSYIVYCDAVWNTTNVIIEGNDRVSGRMRPRLILHVSDGQWFKLSHRSGPERVELALPDLAGCIDVDLGISPSTNTLPIRRLNLAISESRELTAAWVRFPELTIEPLAQRYTRLAERRYRYESTTSGFTAELEVDDLGLVVSYESIWQRVAEGSAEH